MEFDFVGKRVMKEWPIIKYENPSEYKKAIGLFKESMAFVSLKNERFLMISYTLSEVCRHPTVSFIINRMTLGCLISSVLILLIGK
jgi:hypothetical protein